MNPDRPKTLADLLCRRGLDTSELFATYNDLHPLDVCSDFRDITDVVNTNTHHLLDRMHDGPCIPDGALVLSFVANGDRKARLTAFRRFMMRRPGIVPGDIVYNYEAAHLLHGFIARTENPYFYDVLAEMGLDDLIGKLTVVWPEVDSVPMNAACCRLIRLRDNFRAVPVSARARQVERSDAGHKSHARQSEGHEIIVVKG